MNLVLDMAPPEDRPAYIGLYNTLGGTVVSAAPLAGGWILQVTSYSLLFSVTAAGIAAALFLSFRLAEPRHRLRETVTARPKSGQDDPLSTPGRGS